MYNVLLLGNELNDVKNTKIAFCAAYIHDLSRRNDGFCQIHGALSVKENFDKYEKLFLSIGLSNDDLIAIKTASTQHSLVKELDSDRFFRLLKEEYGFDYKSISKFIEGGVYSFNEQHEFNIILRKMKRDKNISISESILFLEDGMLLNHILKFIDDETEWILKDELASRYGIEQNNKLFDILY